MLCEPAEKGYPHNAGLPQKHPSEKERSKESRVRLPSPEGKRMAACVMARKRIDWADTCRLSWKQPTDRDETFMSNRVAGLLPASPIWGLSALVAGRMGEAGKEKYAMSKIRPSLKTDAAAYGRADSAGSFLDK